MYKCVCKDGFYFFYLDYLEKYFNGFEIENEYEKKIKVFYECDMIWKEIFINELIMIIKKVIWIV